MGIPFKKVARKNPKKPDAAAKFYPQIVTLGQTVNLENMAHVMKEKSSLTLGDIQSVITNFVEAMTASLYAGQSVNIANFGVFSLSAHTVGTEKEEDCTAKNIRSVKINFRPSSSIRPSMTSTRAGEKLEFIDVKSLLEKKKEEEGGGDTPGSGGDDPTV